VALSVTLRCPSFFIFDHKKCPCEVVVSATDASTSQNRMS
jgi:hypothetical protein